MAGRGGGFVNRVSSARSFSLFENKTQELLAESLLYLPEDLLPFLVELLKGQPVASNSVSYQWRT